MRYVHPAVVTVVLVAIVLGAASAQPAPPTPAAPPGPANLPTVQAPLDQAGDLARKGADQGGKIAGGIVLLIVVLMPIQLLVVVWRPGFVQRAADLSTGRPGYALLWGLASGALLVLVGIVVAQAKGIGEALGVLIFAATLILGTAGLSGLTLRLGERLLARDGTDQAPRPFVAAQAGTLTGTFVFMVPWLGWLVLLVALLVGLGAAFQALVGRQAARPERVGAGDAGGPASSG